MWGLTKHTHPHTGKQARGTSRRPFSASAASSIRCSASTRRSPCSCRPRPTPKVRARYLSVVSIHAFLPCPALTPTPTPSPQSVETLLADGLGFVERPNETYHRVLLKEVVHHFTQPELPTLFAGAFRQLQPGGRLVIMTRCVFDGPPTYTSHPSPTPTPTPAQAAQLEPLPLLRRRARRVGGRAAARDSLRGRAGAERLPRVGGPRRLPRRHAGQPVARHGPGPVLVEFQRVHRGGDGGGGRGHPGEAGAGGGRGGRGEGDHVSRPHRLHHGGQAIRMTRTMPCNEEMHCLGSFDCLLACFGFVASFFVRRRQFCFLSTPPPAFPSTIIITHGTGLSLLRLCSVVYRGAPPRSNYPSHHHHAHTQSASPPPQRTTHRPSQQHLYTHTILNTPSTALQSTASITRRARWPRRAVPGRRCQSCPRCCWRS